MAIFLEISAHSVDHLFCILVNSHFGFEDLVLVLIVLNQFWSSLPFHI